MPLTDEEKKQRKAAYNKAYRLRKKEEEMRKEDEFYRQLAIDEAAAYDLERMEDVQNDNEMIAILAQEIEEENKQKRNAIVRKIIGYVQEPIKISMDIDSNVLSIQFPNKDFYVTVSKHDNWEQIKLRIDRVLNNDITPDCPLCAETYHTTNKRKTCSICSNNFCEDCFRGIFRSGKGIVKCPYCRDTAGQVVCDEHIELFLQDVCNRLHITYKE